MPKLGQSAFPLVMAALLLASPAAAKNVTANPAQIAALLQAKGYKAEVKEVDGDPYIKTATGGYNVAIYFYGCEKAKSCKTVQLYSAFTPSKRPTLEQMNEFSRNNRWGRGYLDKDGDPVIEMDIDLEQGGMSEALLMDNFAYFEAVLSRFAEFVFKND